MSKKEERKMVFEMLSEGKITVEDAETLLDALETSRRTKPMGFAGFADFQGLDMKDFQVNIQDHLSKSLGELESLEDFMDDFDFDLDWEGI